jgi:rSAM/selenodomain-associated transferase 1
MPTPRDKAFAMAIMAKAPGSGDVKTRLATVLSAEQRASICQAFLLDKVEQIARIETATPCIAFTPKSARRELRTLVGNSVKLVAQDGPDLGARLKNVITELLTDGFGGVLLVDSDSPNLPDAALREAVEALAGPADVVVGPAWDGGYYLIGVKADHPELFAGVAWSTPSVTEETLRACAKSGLGVHVLASWYDVDTPADLHRLARQLAASPEAAPDRPRRTAAALAGFWNAPAARQRNEHFTTLSRRPVYENKWIRLEENLVRTPSGHLTLYGVVVCPPCVGVLPLREDGHVLLVRQFRYVAQRTTLEIPTGGVHDGESLENAARRELREEAGVAAGALLHLSTYHPSKSVMDEVAHVYLGRELLPSEQKLDATEEITVCAVPFAKALEMVDSGEIVDSMTVIALLAADRVMRR